MGWRRRSGEEWQRLVSGWPRSGLTQEAYCAQHGISVGSLQRGRRHPGCGSGDGANGGECRDRVRPGEAGGRSAPHPPPRRAVRS
ncbi:IS66 family insertion sequence element accessory protein TnpA [Thioalkalivibrio halophilus]|uniref:IS66 family insertion sequence element accessory protein TnpA n=1 Tax=Thioalkalivibrio halophilus TaxID=252474 RepID=UPI003CC67336